MTPDRLLAAWLVGGAGACALAAALLLLREARAREVETHVLAVASGRSTSALSWRLGTARNVVRAIGDRVITGTRLYSKKDIALLRDMIAASGRDPRHTLPLLLGGKLVLTLVCPLLAFMYGDMVPVSAMTRLALIAASVPVGMMIPEAVLRWLRRSHAAALDRGVIDALDLLVVCCEAGLALESALDRVSQEMRLANPAIAAALDSLLNELRVLPDRRDALANFARRAGVESLRRLATVLAQTLQYGTPLGQALRAIGSELRRERMIRLEERAAKLPAKLVLPLILFILPCLIIVLVGSSFLRLLDTLGSLAH